VCDEFLEFGYAQLARMALVMKKDVAFDPIDVTLLRPIGIMLGADGIPNLIEQFFLFRERGTLWGWYRLFRHIDSLLSY
jgi:hypothetical protein